MLISMCIWRSELVFLLWFLVLYQWNYKAKSSTKNENKKLVLEIKKIETTGKKFISVSRGKGFLFCFILFCGWGLFANIKRILYNTAFNCSCVILEGRQRSAYILKVIGREIFTFVWKRIFFSRAVKIKQIAI